jgi:hypothetical protein
MIRPNTAHPISFLAVDFDGEALTGLTDLLLTIVDTDSDSATFGQVWDWSTDAFTATPVQATAPLEEVNATYAPGKYALTWPGTAAGHYTAIVTQSPGATVANLPASAELHVRVDAAPGDQMALTSGERTTVQALVLSDATPFQGARIDAAISSRSSHAAADIWAVGARTLTAIGGSGIASQASVDALPAGSATAVWAAVARTLTGIGASGIASQATVDALPTAAGIADAVLDEALAGHATAGTLGAALALLDVAVSTRATAAGVWATVTGNADWTYGECVELARKHITNRLDATAAGNGTLTLYDDDENDAPIVVQTLRDGAGGAITIPTGSPALRGAAA